MSPRDLLLFSLGPAIFIVLVLFPALIGLLSQRAESAIKPLWLSLVFALIFSTIVGWPIFNLKRTWANQETRSAGG